MPIVVRPEGTITDQLQPSVRLYEILTTTVCRTVSVDCEFVIFRRSARNGICAVSGIL
jgi:hypothetical protein